MDHPQSDWDEMRRICRYLFTLPAPPSNAFNPSDYFVLAPPPQTETYVIGKPTDDCDGILIVRTDAAGNVSLEIA